jgi:omega-6 fatty acid desaturase (delta-12 desaturase)
VTSSPLTNALAPFASSDLRSSIWQLVTSVVAFAGLWTLAYLSLDNSYALTVLLAVPAAVCLVRLFIIQHDCGHGSFLPSRRANDVLGTLIGVLTLTPYSYWRRVHAMHHKASGNLDRRGFGDIDTLTIREYLALGRFQRARYRACRNPWVVLLIGPAYQFFVLHRFPTNLPRAWRREWRSVWLTNIALAGMIVCASWFLGVGQFVLVHLPITWIAGSIGVWLFYVQHQFEQTYWAPSSEWVFEEACLSGSSYLDLPPWLHWCTGTSACTTSICARIPNYRLHRTLEAHPSLRQAAAQAA